VKIQSLRGPAPTPSFGENALRVGVAVLLAAHVTFLVGVTAVLGAGLLSIAVLERPRR